MKIFITIFAALFVLCCYSDTIQIKVYPYNEKTRSTTYSLPRTVTANRTLVFSKYQNESGDDFQYATIPFKGRSIDGYSYFYYIEIYYGGPSSASNQNIFIGSNQNSATGAVPVDTWRTSGYDWTYSPNSVEFRYTSGVAIIFVWEVQVPAGTSPSGSPPSDGSSGSYGTVTIPPATETNPNPLPTLSNPPAGSNPPTDSGGSGGGDTGGGDTGGGDTGGGDTGGGDTGGGDTGGGDTGGGDTGGGDTGGGDTGGGDTGGGDTGGDDDEEDDETPKLYPPSPPAEPPIKINPEYEKVNNHFNSLQINTTSGGSFNYPSFNIPLPSGATASINLGNIHSSVVGPFNNIKAFVRALCYALVTVIFFFKVFKLFRKNS